MTDRERNILKLKARFELLRRKAQNGNFWAFCLFYDYEFFIKRPVLKLIADAMQRVYHCYRNNVSIKIACSLPPRAGKSYITSLFSAFMLGHFPAESVMRNACTSKLYEKFSIDTRDVILSAKFAQCFPDAVMHRSRRNIDGWSLTDARQISYFGAGVGGAIIGFGASMLSITDDLFKSFEDAVSTTINEKTWSWKEGSHDSRTEGNCCEIAIGTRWSKKDVIGTMEERGKFDIIVRIPALIDGVSFCEDVHTTAYYLELEKDIDEVIWAAEYMQEPTEAKGLLFPRSELNLFTLDEINGKEPDGVIGATDVADKGNDYFSSPFAKIFKDRFFITDVVYTQDPVEVTEASLVATIIDTLCSNIRIESNNGGRLFARNIKRMLSEAKHTNCEVSTRFTSANKETKILLRSGFIKKHFWFRSDYTRGSDYAKFMKSLTEYMKMGSGQVDDAPDSLVILVEFIESLGIIKTSAKTEYKAVTKGALGIS